MNSLLRFLKYVPTTLSGLPRDMAVRGILCSDRKLKGTKYVQNLSADKLWLGSCGPLGGCLIIEDVPQNLRSQLVAAPLTVPASLVGSAAV